MPSGKNKRSKALEAARKEEKATSSTSTSFYRSRWTLFGAIGAAIAIGTYFFRTSGGQAVSLERREILDRIDRVRIDHLTITPTKTESTLAETKISYLTSSKPLPTSVEKLIRDKFSTSSSEARLARILHNPHLSISVVAEQALHTIKGTNSELTYLEGAYDPLNNKIYLNEDLVAGPFLTPEKIDQLANVIMNEVSHALSHSTKITKTTGNYILAPHERTKEKIIDLFYPWTSVTEFRAIESAYRQYEERVEYLKTLSKTPHKKLTHEQREELNKFNRVMQEYYKAYNTGPAAGYRPTVIPNPKDKQFKKWHRNRFFADHENFQGRIEFGRSENAMYQATSDPQALLVEQLSDFDMLHPQVQRFLAAPLCEALDRVHGFSLGMYCSRFAP